MSNTFTKTSLRGFTLIELLVVIAIIGLLSTAIMGPVQTGLKKGRDTRKISDISQIQGGLIQYAGDNNGKYPDYLITTDAQFLLGSTTLASTSPTYMVPDAKMLGNAPAGGLTKLPAARDRFSYVTYKDTAGNIVSYHLGTALENQNASLQGDADCGNAAASPFGDAIGGGTTKACDGGIDQIPHYSNFVSPPGSGIGNPNLSHDFGGAGTMEDANEVCAANLSTCIFDVTPN